MKEETYNSSSSCFFQVVSGRKKSFKKLKKKKMQVKHKMLFFSSEMLSLSCCSDSSIPQHTEFLIVLFVFFSFHFASSHSLLPPQLCSFFLFTVVESELSVKKVFHL